MKTLLLLLTLATSLAMNAPAQADCSALNSQGPDVCSSYSFCRWQPGYEEPGSCEKRNPSDPVNCWVFNSQGPETCSSYSFCRWQPGYVMPGSCVNR